MASFKDSEGRSWEIAIDGPVGMRIRQELDPEFLLGDEDAESATLTRLGKDRLLRASFVQLFCDRQREARQLTVEQFWDALHDGDVIANAMDALSQAIINFTPPHQRKLLQAIVDKQREVESLGATMGMAKLNDPTINQKLTEAMQSRLDSETENALTRFANATDSPDSAESTPPA